MTTDAERRSPTRQGAREASPEGGCTACGASAGACRDVSGRGSGEIGRIGPNALIQTARALEARLGLAEARRLLGLAGMGELVVRDPLDMRDEREFFRLVSFLEAALSRREVIAVLHDAGLRTGAYVLANRVPGGVRLGLRVLPRALRLRLTLAAMASHAWTFAGSGRFAFETRPHPTLRLVHGQPALTVPDPAPLHAFYRGAFEVLLRALVASGTELEERAPSGQSPRAGVDFRLRFDGPHARPPAGDAPTAARTVA